MSVLRRVVVVSKAPELHRLARELAQEVFAADDAAEAADIISTVGPELALFDGTVPPAEIRAHLPRVPVDRNLPCTTVAVLASDSPFSAAEYRQAGIGECLADEPDFARLRDIVAGTSEVRPAQANREAGNDTRFFLDETAAAVALAGRSPAVEKTLHMLKLVAASPCNPVLVVGDTGTGKEVAARAIHTLRHPGQPFVAVNCAALTATLLESELFGHVKGSFTGADRDKTGLLEMADSGTIFLDEISEMPLELQAKLLRVLQEKTFRKVGGVRDLDCKATIITSSNRDLKKEVREKRFRRDLYYRLNLCPILLPPLRSAERRQDIPLLALFFLKTSSLGAHKQRPITSLTPLALEALCRYDWPGNVRELRNVIERALLLETTDKIGLSSIIIDPIDSEAPPHAGLGSQTRCSAFGDPLGRHEKDFSLEKAERELIARALHETGWQKTQAAALLGITRATLYAKVRQYDIRKKGLSPDEAGAPVSPAPESMAEATC
jgi:DNA-binding NtrC family response regulator